MKNITMDGSYCIECDKTLANCIAKNAIIMPFNINANIW